jgi:hypothetical protein
VAPLNGEDPFELLVSRTAARRGLVLSQAYGRTMWTRMCCIGRADRSRLSLRAPAMTARQPAPAFTAAGLPGSATVAQFEPIVGPCLSG